MMRPAGSSAAELMRRPVERRVIDLLSSFAELETLLKAFIALMFVLIRNDIQSSVILPTLAFPIGSGSIALGHPDPLSVQASTGSPSFGIHGPHRTCTLCYVPGRFACQPSNYARM